MTPGNGNGNGGKKPPVTIAAALGEKVKSNERKLRTLREEIASLADTQRIDSKKLDDLTEKVTHVVEVLNKIAPDLAKLTPPKNIGEK